MRELLEAVLDNGMSAARALYYVLPVILAVGAVLQLVPRYPVLRGFFAGLMVAVWVVTVLYCLLAWIEAMAYDRDYGYGIFVFPAYMALSLVVATIGLVLRRVRRRRT